MSVNAPFVASFNVGTFPIKSCEIVNAMKSISPIIFGEILLILLWISYIGCSNFCFDEFSLSLSLSLSLSFSISLSFSFEYFAEFMTLANSFIL